MKLRECQRMKNKFRVYAELEAQIRSAFALVPPNLIIHLEWENKFVANSPANKQLLFD